jgi:environmental stress-induced protein Ves
MPFHLIPKETQRIMPWKNGGGVTTEFAIYPSTASVANGFTWRISKATILSSGPFSVFPQVQRTIMLLTEGRIELRHGDGGARANRILRRGEPYTFSGEWATHGELLDETLQDLNFMCRQGEAETKDLGIIDLAPNTSCECLGGSFTFLLGLMGDVDVTAGEESVRLCADDALLIEDSPSVTLSRVNMKGACQVATGTIQLLTQDRLSSK